ncbi:tRNA dihydrouridine synthase [Salinispira pacifica]
MISPGTPNSAGRPQTVWDRLPRPARILAPMEDVTDTVFRRIVARAGRPDLFFTEFTGADALFTRARRSVGKRLQFTPEERPIIAQIWGNNPENYFRAAGLIREMGFDGLDINMGCPMKKIIRKGHCSALIENPSLARELVLAAMEGAGSMPVSVKTRIGLHSVRTEEWCGFLLELEPAALTVHGRISAQQSEGRADWNEVARVVRLRDAMGIRTRIVGNGDVQSLSEVREKHRLFGVDGVMIGRGIFENLFLFREDGKDYASLTPAEKIGYFRRHMQLYHETWGERRNYEVLKKFVKTYIREFDGAAGLVDGIMQTHAYEEAEVLLESFLESLRAPALSDAAIGVTSQA